MEATTVRDAALAELERVQAEAAAMREALERLLGDKLPIFPCDHDVGVCYCKEIGEVEMIEAALSTSAGADLLAELARLREVERLAKEYRAARREYQQVLSREDLTNDMGFQSMSYREAWEDEIIKAAEDVSAAEDALFAALGKEAAE